MLEPQEWAVFVEPRKGLVKKERCLMGYLGVYECVSVIPQGAEEWEKCTEIVCPHFSPFSHNPCTELLM
jgi:hypothetical protein